MGQQQSVVLTKPRLRRSPPSAKLRRSRSAQRPKDKHKSGRPRATSSSALGDDSLAVMSPTIPPTTPSVTVLPTAINGGPLSATTATATECTLVRPTAFSVDTTGHSSGSQEEEVSVSVSLSERIFSHFKTPLSPGRSSTTLRDSPLRRSSSIGRKKKKKRQILAARRRHQAPTGPGGSLTLVGHWSLTYEDQAGSSMDMERTKSLRSTMSSSWRGKSHRPPSVSVDAGSASVDGLPSCATASTSTSSAMMTGTRPKLSHAKSWSSLIRASSFKREPENESDDEDEESDISATSKMTAGCLGKDLDFSLETQSQFADSIEVMFNFWSLNVTPMLENPSRSGEYQMLSMLFYANVFKLIPGARDLFLSKDIATQAKQFMGMFGWLILCLGKPGAEKLIYQLRRLGDAHTERGVRYEYYASMLEAFHDTFTEMFPDTYTLRVRFSMTQLFTVAADVMCKTDFTSTASASRLDKHEVMEYIISFDACLSHPKGKVFLQKFMQQQFCHELWSFMETYRRYKGALDESERRFIGREIMENFIEMNSPMQVNIAFETVRYIKERLDVLGGMEYPRGIFDGAASEVKVLAKSNCWSKFQMIMIDVSGAGDLYREWKQKHKEEMRKKKKQMMHRSSDIVSSSRGGYPASASGVVGMAEKKGPAIILTRSRSATAGAELVTEDARSVKSLGDLLEKISARSEEDE